MVRADALEFLAHDTRAYDVVFHRPTVCVLGANASPAERVALAARGPRDAGASVYLESPEFPELPPAVGGRSNEARAGAVHYQLLEEADVQ